MQVAESIRGGMDASVLERMVKIMSYMRGSSGKPGKMKKKDKLRMLQVGSVLNRCPCCGQQAVCAFHLLFLLQTLGFGRHGCYVCTGYGWHDPGWVTAAQA